MCNPYSVKLCYGLLKARLLDSCSLFWARQQAHYKTYSAFCFGDCHCTYFHFALCLVHQALAINP